jgi:biotin operon repressor
MEPIKEAFSKVKEDINILRKEVNNLKLNFIEVKEKITNFSEIIREIKDKIKDNNFVELKNTSTKIQQNLTTLQNIPTHNSCLEALKDQNSNISIGNEGVPTDKQTNRQTDKHTQLHHEYAEKPLEDAFKIINSLDNIKKEIRLKFKRLTNQEFLVFSTLYQLDQEFGYSNYKNLSQKLHLSESSIRDYIGRLIKKGIPIEKNKINNKNIHLLISENLKKITTLQTILQLRNI